MFLQVAIDAHDSHDALTMLDRVKDIKEIDYIEIGAPLVTHYGVPLFHTFVGAINPNRIYVDLKTIDFPRMELTPWLQAGATRLSVMAIMNNQAFHQLKDMRDEWKFEVLVSMMGYPLECVPERVKQLVELGFDSFIAHGAGVGVESAFDQTLKYCKVIRDSNRQLNLIAAGGITWGNASSLREFRPYGVIMGRGLTQHVGDLPLVRHIARVVKVVCGHKEAAQ